MNIELKIENDLKPSISAVLKRLRAEAFGGDRQKTSAFLRACLGDFGVPVVAQEATLNALLDDLNGSATTPVQTKLPPIEGSRFATDFLYGWPGGKCDLFQLSLATTDAERAANREHKKKFGHTVVCPYMVNRGDGDGKHPVDALQDVDRVKSLLSHMTLAGYSIVPIIFSDSHNVDPTHQPAVAASIIQAFDDYVTAWCLYLEPLDTAKKDLYVNETGKVARAATKKQIFIQTHGIGGAKCDINEIRWVKQSWCDGVFVQITHPDKPIKLSDVPAIWNKLVVNSNGKLVVPFEYSWKVDDYKLGDEFVKHGAPGFGDGGSKETSENLPSMLQRAAGPTPTIPSGATAPTSTPASSSGAVLLEVKKSSKDKYIDFRYSGIEDWQEKKDSKGNLKGWIVLNGVRVEQFRVGYTKQHLNNAYGHDEHGVRGIKTGDTVSVSLQSTDLKHKTNSLPFTWPWGNT